MNFIRQRSPSLSMVVLVLLGIMLMQGEISYSTTFGRLDTFIRIPGINHGALPTAWLIARTAAMTVVVLLWLLDRKKRLFRSIIVMNVLLTLGLFMNLTALADALFGISPQAIDALLIDVVLMAVTNILIFSIWYWIIDPPGVEETLRLDEPWDFLFPQRGSELPGYEAWLPRYSDYLYLAFTTSFAFSPTDTLPLTRRAKMLMLLQSTLSLITLTGIAGAAINILAGGV
jgi:hypothetical protein